MPGTLCANSEEQALGARLHMPSSKLEAACAENGSLAADSPQTEFSDKTAR